MNRLFYFDEEEEVIIRRISYIITSLIVVFSMTAITASAKPDWLIDKGAQSETDIVMDIDSGAVLSAQNIHEQKIPASITKLLTALVVIENTNDLDAPVIFSHDAIYNMESGVGNKFNPEGGDVLSVRQCLCAMLSQSSNQPINALAEYVAGGRQALVSMMNQRIEELGYDESHFANPSGSNDNTQRTTAYDVAIIARACFQNPTALGVASVGTSPIPITVNNPNGWTFSIEHKMLLPDDSNYYLGAIAGKTGWTLQAGQTLVTYVRREGKGQIATTFMSTQRTHYSDTKIILDSRFTKFKNMNITDNETEYVTGNAPVTIGVEIYNPSELFIDSRAVITIPNDAQFTDADKAFETDLPESHPQEAAARLVYTYNKRRVGDAWIYSSSARAVDATPSEPGRDIPPESRLAEDGQGGNTDFTLPRAVPIGGGAVLVLALSAGGGVLWFKRRQAAEWERQRILREKCRQRLADIGYTEEDFEHLLDERRKQHDTR